jgi:hypothetical protein
MTSETVKNAIAELSPEELRKLIAEAVESPAGEAVIAWGTATIDHKVEALKAAITKLSAQAAASIENELQRIQAEAEPGPSASGAADITEPVASAT